MQRPPQSSVDVGVSSSKHAVIGALVFALHIFLGYAIVTGLASRIVASVPTVLHAEVLPPVEEPEPPPAPPPLPVFVQPTVPTMPTVPAPVIHIARNESAANAITAVQGPPRAVEADRTTPALEPVAPHVPSPVPVIAPVAPRSVVGTHTTPPYPDLSRRLGEQGTVRLHIAIDASGKISAVAVEQSSGSTRLDEAAVNWVRIHWRYHPAKVDDKPVASTVRAAVVFDLTHGAES